jgi:AcrR family transcriptional regulator
MARPRSDDKRAAIMDAATRLIVSQGLNVATAAIAKEAGVANGSLFTYFATKADLFNQLYLGLKTEMANTASQGVSPTATIRDQFARAWSNWMRWTLKNPDKRRALAQLGVSSELTSATRASGHQVMGAFAALMERSRAKGPMRDVSLAYLGALMNAIADTTMDFILNDRPHAEKHSKTGFEALWRMIAPK